MTSALRLALADIKLAHTVFALPFALLGALLAAAPNRQAGWFVDDPARAAAAFAAVLLAMAAARTFAMLVNRLADRRFDADNPRTARRPLASGRLPVPAAAALAAASAALFTLAAAAFWPILGNHWPIILAAPVLAWIALYSFTKRFTWLCHAFLGSALAISPLAAALAIRPDVLLDPQWSDTARALAALAGFVLLWVAGFDVAYALQDLDFDRRAGLHSAPARFGMLGALRIARALHAAAALLLFAAVLAEPRLGLPSLLGAALVALLLLAEHVLLARRGPAGLPIAFFAINGSASVAIGLLAGADLLIRAL